MCDTYDDGSSGGEGEDSVTREPNLYRDALLAHKLEVGDDVSYSLTPPSGFGHPCTAACQSVTDGAWVSPAADDWVSEIDTLGSSIRSAFNNYYADVVEACDAEPTEVDVPGPEDWKADWVTTPRRSPYDPMPNGASIR